MAHLLEPRAAAEIRQVDDERAADDRPAGDADELERRFGRCRRSRSGRRRAERARRAASVAVHLETIDAVLELVVLPKFSAGSLPPLRIGTKPACIRYASAAPTMKPRDSIAAILSIGRP
jgi:hypothetical protein